MKKPIRLAIIDDHRETLNNLTDLLNYSSEVKIVLSVNSGLKFLKQIREIPEDEHPQVVLTDIEMPKMSGIELVMVAKCRFPKMEFLMLTVHDDEALIFKAIKAGAKGYLLKDEKISVIIKHLQTLVYEGGAPMSPTIAAKTFHLLKSGNTPQTSKKEFPALSDREKEVLLLLVDGQDYNSIAKTLFVSKNTIKKHISHIYQKLHVTSRAQAIKLCYYYGLI